jgi:acetylornithine/succinyldiaminopimelate/putrescine aminotransferase
VATEDQFQLATYKKMPIVAERGDGVWIYTSDGEKYLDLYGGHAVAGTGHCHPHVVESIREQAGNLIFYSNLVYSSARARAAEKLVSIAPDALTKTFFCNSGTEANENAMRIAFSFASVPELQKKVFISASGAIETSFSAARARAFE